MSDYVTEYKGPNDYHSTSSYLVKSFGSLYSNPSKELIVHLTCATGASSRPVSTRIATFVEDANHGLCEQMRLKCDLFWLRFRIRLSPQTFSPQVRGPPSTLLTQQKRS